MNNWSVRSAVLLVGSIILLAALYLHAVDKFMAGIALHALAVCIPCSLGYVLNELELDSFKNILSMLAVFSFGIAIAGIMASIMISAGVLFVVLSVAIIIGVAYWV